MIIHTVVHSYTEIIKSYEELKTRIKVVHSSCKEHTSLFMSSTDDLLLYTNLQSLFNQRFESNLTNKLFQLFLRYAVLSEKTSPGSFNIFVELLLKDTTTKSLMGVSVETHRATLSDMNDCIDRYVQNNLLKQVTKNALDLSGFTGKILIEKTSGRSFVVEKTNGYAFDIATSFKCNKIYANPRILLIDGFVESVSEIQELLREASETKDNLFLFVRGMSDDVINTLKVNFIKRTLNVIPYVLKLDVCNVNTFKDIAVISGTDVVSPLKGQLICCLKLKDTVSVDKITVYDNRFVIVNKSTKKSMLVLTQLLKEKSQHSQQVSGLYDKRIRFLTDSCVVIKIPDDMNYVTNSQSIDYVLRSLSSLSVMGIVKNSRIEEFNNKPRLTVESVMSHYESFLRTLNSLGSCVVSC